MSKFLIIIIGIVAFVLSSNIYSQNDDIRDKIEDIKLEKMTAKLNLDETTKSTFIDIYKNFSKRMKELNRKRVKTYKLMVENVESGYGLDTIVSKLLENENEITQTRKDFIADIKALLTPQQIAKMIIFERKFNNEIKKILKQYQKENRNGLKD